MAEISAHHAAAGRAVAGYLKPRETPGNGLAQLSDAGFHVPRGLSDLYAHYSGVDCGDRLNRWASNVFLQFDFLPEHQVIDLSLRAPDLDPGNPSGVVRFTGTSFFNLGTLCFYGDDLVRAAVFPLSQKTYVAFEGLETMLVSICRAYEAGLVNYDEDGRIDYSFKEVWEIFGELNPTADYWPALINRALDWEVPGTLLPDFSRSKWG